MNRMPRLRAALGLAAALTALLSLGAAPAAHAQFAFTAPAGATSGGTITAHPGDVITFVGTLTNNYGTELDDVSILPTFAGTAGNFTLQYPQHLILGTGYTYRIESTNSSNTLKITVKPSATPGTYAFYFDANAAGDDNGDFTGDIYSDNYKIQVVASSATPTTLTAANVTGFLGQPVTLTATLANGTAAVSGETVTFSVGGTAVGSAVTNSGGVASFSYVLPNSLGQGTHPIAAAFAGDSAYGASSGTATLTAFAHTAVAVPNVSGVRGQTVTLSGTLTRTTDNTPLSGETLTFKVDGTSVGTETTNSSGVATHSYVIPSGLSAGSHTLTVFFGGDGAAYYTDSSGAGTLTVAGTATATTVAGASAAYGQPVTLTATIHAGGPSVSGRTITFSIDGTTVGTAVTGANSSASFAYPNADGLAPGNHTITAAFAGDATYAASSGTGRLTVTTAGATLTVANVTGARGATVTLSATLTRTGDGAAISGRVLTFKVDGTTVGTETTNPNGYAARSYVIPTGFAPGAHTITVTSPADADYNAASGTGTLTVSTITTATTVSGASAAFGQPVTLTATIHAGGPSVSGRTITFSVDGTTVGAAVTNGGSSASFAYPNADGLAPGNHTITASFAGDSTYAASSGTGRLTIAKANAAVAVANVSGTGGQTVTFSATLTRSPDGSPVSGRVLTFKVGDAALGTETTDPNGSAAKSYVIPAGSGTGSRTITVSFGGDADYNAASGTGTLTVN